MEVFWYIIAALGAGIGTGLAGLSAATVMVPILIVLCPSFSGETGTYQATAIALASDILGSAVTTYTYALHRDTISGKAGHKPGRPGGQRREAGLERCSDLALRWDTDLFRDADRLHHSGGHSSAPDLFFHRGPAFRLQKAPPCRRFYLLYGDAAVCGGLDGGSLYQYRDRCFDLPPAGPCREGTVVRKDLC